MPCYDPPPTNDDIARWRSRDDKTWYDLTPKEHIKQWLCDAMRGNLPSEDASRWFELHKRFDDQKRTSPRP